LTEQTLSLMHPAIKREDLYQLRDSIERFNKLKEKQYTEVIEHTTLVLKPNLTRWGDQVYSTWLL